MADGQIRMCLTLDELRQREQEWYEFGRLRERIEQNSRRIAEFRAEQEGERQSRERRRA